MSRRSMTFVAIAALMLAPTAALAQTGALTVVVGGEAFNGPPKFEVSFNGEKLGEATVDSAIDTVSAGRFVEAESKAAHLQSFDFAIPDSAFSPNGFVRIHFLNEANEGAGSPHDRNLYVFSVAVNGRVVPARELTTVAAQGRVPSPMLGEYLALLDESTTAVAAAPAGGWPATGSQVAVAPPAAPAITQQVVETAAAQVAVPPPAETVAAIPAEEAIPAAAPVRMTLPQAAAAPVPVPAPAPATAVAAVDPATTGAVSAPDSACALDQIYNVIGFNENSNDLTPKLETRLDQILADIGANECLVQVVGYSSTVGDYATNALFAVERAQNVLTYLRSKGLHVAKATATGAGETEQFGPDPIKNRRVVITVMP